jgi:Bacterial SH3 domain.
MKKKTILILISLLHICVFCVGILIFFQTKQTSRENSNLISDAAVRITETESDTLIELSSTESFSTEPPESEQMFSTIEEFLPESTFVEDISEPFMEESFSEISSVEDISEPITENISVPKSSYTFKYIPHNNLKLNIRNAPSMQGKIIGKVPPNKGGTILEFTNKDWALIEYNGTTGYSNLHCIILHPQKN